jgi:hydrogenase maturation protease
MSPGASAGVAPILVLGWGNPSRGDDALGPAFVARASALPVPPGAPAIEWLTDFQLQIEHALDLAGRSQVLFVDASVDSAAPCAVRDLRSATQRQLTTHAMAPEAVMQVYEQLHGQPAPPCTLLAIRASSFELGEPIGADAQQHLAQALDWFVHWWSAQAPPAPLAPPCTS